jgi:ABC-type polysaccharide/polyol phosphate export permease
MRRKGLAYASAMAGGGLASEGRRLAQLTIHLALREVSARHRFTTLGWLWPLTRQLAQFGVLLLVFTSVVDLDIHDYPAFLFTGLVAWSWFSSGLTDGTGSLIAHRHLLFRPRCPAAVLPVAASTVALVDSLIALPVLIGIVAVSGDLAPSVLFLPVLAVIQLLLVCGLAWLASAASVYLRDVTQIVLVGLLLLFYLTPVFYETARVPDEYEWVIRLNPLTPLLEGYRDVLVEGHLPPAGPVAAVAAASVAAAALGLVVFQRLRRGFVDEL